MAVDSLASQILERSRRTLAAARASGDGVAAAAARSLITALQHAEAAGIAATTAPTTGPIAGAANGLGASDVPRRVLDDAAGRAVVDHELAERRDVAAQLEDLGRHDAAHRLRAEAAVILTLTGPAGSAPQPPLPGRIR
ncbi:MAG TPA: hypothetical protein VK866_14220 [Acidimicrobiales bacterium]|nr:hypothetical protein [Acidimicrobiales bacterium]